MMRTLTYQETDADARHVETVEPMLDVKIDVPRVLTAFPLENTLRDRGHGRVMALLDSFKELGERAVVLAHFWGPFLDMRRVGIVPGQGLRGGEDECRREDGMSVLSCSEKGERTARLPSLHRDAHLLAVTVAARVPILAVLWGRDNAETDVVATVVVGVVLIL